MFVDFIKFWSGHCKITSDSVEVLVARGLIFIAVHNRMSLSGSAYTKYIDRWQHMSYQQVVILGTCIHHIFPLLTNDSYTLYLASQ